MDPRFKSGQSRSEFHASPVCHKNVDCSRRENPAFMTQVLSGFEAFPEFGPIRKGMRFDTHRRELGLGMWHRPCSSKCTVRAQGGERPRSMVSNLNYINYAARVLHPHRKVGYCDMIIIVHAPENHQTNVVPLSSHLGILKGPFRATFFRTTFGDFVSILSGCLSKQLDGSVFFTHSVDDIMAFPPSTSPSNPSWNGLSIWDPLKASIHRDVHFSGFRQISGESLIRSPCADSDAKPVELVGRKVAR